MAIKIYSFHQKKFFMLDQKIIFAAVKARL